MMPTAINDDSISVISMDLLHCPLLQRELTVIHAPWAEHGKECDAILDMTMVFQKNITRMLILDTVIHAGYNERLVGFVLIS